MDYLEKAAEQIKKAASEAPRISTYKDSVNAQLRCARAYAMLAAIDRRMLPQQLATDIYRDFDGKD